MGDNIFIIADSHDGKNLRYISAPFYVNMDGQIHKFIPDKQQMQKYIFEKRKNKLNVDHTLFYWDVTENRFTPLSYDESTYTTQTYYSIPANSLLRFTIPERIVNQRVFFLENGDIKNY